MKTLLLSFLLYSGIFAFADPSPIVPENYFNDEAKIVSPNVAETLNDKLQSYERKTSNQILVAIYPTLPENVVLEEYTLTLARTWGVGQAGKDNGIVLFVFMKGPDGHGVDRIEVGRGLEGAVPDATGKHLLADVLNPSLKAKTYDKGFTEVVDQLIALTDPEFVGTGKTVVETKHAPAGFPFLLLLLVFPLLLVIVAVSTVIAKQRRARELKEEAEHQAREQKRYEQEIERLNKEYEDERKRAQQAPKATTRIVIPPTARQTAPKAKPKDGTESRRSSSSTAYIPIPYDSGRNSGSSSSSNDSGSSSSSSDFGGGGGSFGGGGSSDSF